MPQHREISSDPPQRVAAPLMYQRWETLTFLHWPYAPAQIAQHLPEGLEIDTYGDMAWVGLVPFYIRNLRPPFLPALPWISAFPETNLRTYVRGPDGYPGVWFFSLDCSRAAAVMAARSWYGLPYFHSEMEVEKDGGIVHYTSHRKEAPDVMTNVRVRAGLPFSEDKLGARDHFLTARFRLYAQLNDELLYAQVEHPRWPLSEVIETELTENLTAAAGLPTPEGRPLAHFSEGVDVRIGAPQRCR